MSLSQVMMSTLASEVRDEWMKRTGPFYPLLVAFRLHTRLPIAATLEPTEEDVRRASPWIMGVAFLLGGGLALCATFLRWSPLVPAIAATLLISCAAFVTGAYSERGLVASVQGLWGDGVSTGSGHLLAAVLVRLGLVLGTAPHAWPAAFVLAAVSGKLAYLVAERLPWDMGDDPDNRRSPIAEGLTPARWGVIGVSALLASLAFAGPWGLVALAVAVGLGAYAAGPQRRLSPGAVVGVVELLALVLIAATAPAAVSPLVSPP